MSRVLVVFDGGSASPELVGAATKLGDVSALVIDSSHLAGDWAPALADEVCRAAPRIALIPHNAIGRDLAPRVAFRLGAPLVTDCTAVAIDGDDVVLTKPVHGGSALAEYRTGASLVLATLRPRAFAPATPAEVEAVSTTRLTSSGSSQMRLVETVRSGPAAGPSLKGAKVVVAGGRGLGGPESWYYVEELAAAFGAAVGASRAVTDAGWVPPNLQVGLTGATVTPDLYIAIGISGAVQHIAGCAGARTLVAINRDAGANIFRHARYGVVGDFKEVLPALIERVKELRAS